MTIDGLDFPTAIDDYLDGFRKVVAGRGDEIVQEFGPDGSTLDSWILGIMTHDGHPISLQINYTP